MLQSLLQFVEVAHLYLNLQLLAFLLEVRLTAVEGVLDAACEVHVVVLEQYHVEESDAVVGTSANLHGLLLQHAHSRGGLTGVEHPALRTLQLLHIACCHGGYAAHALHHVEHQSLGLQQRAHLAPHDEGYVTHLHVVTVVQKLLHLEFGVKAMEYLLCHFHACQDAVFLDEQFLRTHRVLRDAA